MTQNKLFSSEKIEIPRDLPEYAGVMFFLWKKGESAPIFVMDGAISAEGSGRVIEILAAMLLTIDSDFKQIIHASIDSIAQQIETQTRGTVN